MAKEQANGARADGQPRRQAVVNARVSQQHGQLVRRPQHGSAVIQRLRKLSARKAWLARLEAESKSQEESEAARVEEARLARLAASKAAKASEEDELAEKFGGLKMEKK